MMRVCVGGTFSPFHKGHEALLRKACDVAGPKGHVFIGITEGKLVRNKGRVASFEARKKTVEAFLLGTQVLPQILIQPIDNMFGPTIEQDFDAIVVSSETKKNAEQINRERKRYHKEPLKIIQISFVLSDDGKPISSSRIRSGEITRNGAVVKGD